MQIIDSILDYSKLEADGMGVVCIVYEFCLLHYSSAVKLEYSGFSVENLLAVGHTACL